MTKFTFNSFKRMAVAFCAAAFVSTVLFGSVAQAQNCSAHFQHQAGGNTNSVVFYPYQNPGNTHYYWTFGDNTTSDMANPTHTYNGAGVYYVCLHVVDTLNGVVCDDSWCDSVTVGATMLSCDAHYTVQITGNVGVFSGNNNPSGSTYGWSFGDGTYGTGQHITHTFPGPGAYWVCLVVEDSTLCRDQRCDSVHIYPTTATCNAHFNWGMCNNTLTCIGFHSSGNPSNTHYWWTFGDGATSDGANPSHTYASAGAYYVCLTVVDTLNGIICNDHFCDSVHVSTPPPPVCNAHFTWGPCSASNCVSFHGSQNPYGTHYSWSFGDGTTSDNANPYHIYASAGVYYVCLTVTDTTLSGICSDHFCDSVRIVPPPPPVCNAHFTWGPCNALNCVSFHSSQNPTGTHYSWTFGDGNVSDNANPTHVYASGGTYYVCLTVTDTTFSGICTDHFCDSIHISTPPPPVCNAHFTWGLCNNTVNCICFHGAINPTGTHYYWSFGDGASSYGPNPDHCYASGGTYYVCLTVTDSTSHGSCTDHFCDSIHVANPPPPVCNAHFTSGPCSALNCVSFHSSPNPFGTHYSWTFGDGATSDNANPYHVYASGGTYYVCLTVTDTTFSGICTDHFCDSVHINPPPPPVCNAHFTWGPCNTLNCISFHSSVNQSGTHYSWSFGDGTTSDNANPSHVYATGGTYYVCLTVTDTVGTSICTDHHCDSIHISGTTFNRCNAEFRYYTGSNPAHSVTFIAALNPAGTVYSWNFGDGGTSNYTNPLHVYASAGSYHVCLTVNWRSGNDSCTATWCTTLQALIPVHNSSGLSKSIMESASDAPSALVYPNPMSEFATVSLINVGSTVSFRMYDNTGRLVYRKDNISEANFVISKNDLTPGLYFYQVSDDNNMISKGKLVVQ